MIDKQLLKESISSILRQAISGRDPLGEKDTRYRTDDGFIRWGIVEEDMHKIIEES